MFNFHSIFIDGNYKISYHSFIKEAAQTNFTDLKKLFIYLSDKIDEYLARLKESGYSSSSLKRKKVALKKYLYTFLTPEQRMNRAITAYIDEVYKIHVANFQASQTNIRYLKRHEVEKLIENTPHYLSLIIKTFFYAGLQVSELANITLTNCRIKAQIVNISVLGKGNKTRTILFTGESV